MTRGILWSASILAVVYCVLQTAFPVPAALIGLVSTALFMWGCSRYARAKGRSQVFGALLGILNVVGLAIVHYLPDRPSLPTGPRP